MSTFLTVKEAANVVGKSPSSIRRIIYPILEHDAHPDRHQIEPSPEDAQALRLKGESFAWKISEELLRREVPDIASKGRQESKTDASPNGDRGLAFIDMLRRELEIKNHQIETQNELLKGLSERLREGNILIGSLQKQLTLTDGSSRSKPEIVTADVPTKPKQGSVNSDKVPKQKLGFFGRLFR